MPLTEIRNDLKRYRSMPPAWRKNFRDGIRANLARKPDDPLRLDAHDISLADVIAGTMRNGERVMESLLHGGEEGGVFEGAHLTDTATFRFLATGMFRQLADMAWTTPTLIANSLTTQTEATNAPRGRRLPAGVRIKSTDVKDGIGENEEYPVAGPSEFSILTGPVVKFGVIQKMSRELIQTDPTGGLAMDTVRQGEEAEAIKFDIWVLKFLTGVSNNYVANFSGADVSYNTYNAALPGGNANLVTSNPLGTLDAIQNVYNRGATFVNPGNGDLAMAGEVRQILVPHQLRVMAQHLKSITQVERVDTTTPATTYRTFGANPYDVNFDIVSSPWVYNVTGSATTWFAGDFRRAFFLAYLWQREITTRGAESDAAFFSDTFFMWKSSRACTFETRRPELVFKNTA
jgi:hypothetical protein